MADPWKGRGRTAASRHPAGRASRLTLAAAGVAASWFLLLAALGAPLIAAAVIASVALGASMLAFGVAGGADPSRQRQRR